MTHHELNDLCMDKIRYVLRGAAQPLTDEQLEHMLEQIEPLFLTYLAQAQRLERNDMVVTLTQAGFDDAVALFRS